MSKRAYGQFCGLARALELVGERWALLLVRDLLVGPRRFTDLRRGLPRMPTNVLSTRLRQLEHTGVVRRRLLPRPDSAVVYELTEYGRDLEEAVMALGRWGARSLGQPRVGEVLTADAMIMAMRALFRPAVARSLRAGYELRLGQVVVHARIDNGALHTGSGPLPGADLTIESGPALPALMAGELAPGEAVANGSVRVVGDPDLLATFVDVFRIPPAPAVTAA
jgi:DNA-binding HxlR family transcriptional regulator